MSDTSQQAVIAGASLLIAAAAHRYLYLRLVRDITVSPRLRRAGRATAAALTVLVPSGVLAAEYADPTRIGWLARPVFAWVACAAYLLMALAVLEIPRRLAVRSLTRRAKAGSGTSPGVDRSKATGTDTDTGPDTGPGTGTGRPTAETPGRDSVADGPWVVDRRLVLARSVALLATTTAVATTGYGFHRGLGPPDVKTVRIGLRRLHPSLTGMRITMACDLHLGPFFGRGHTSRIVRMINDTSPDLVAIVGDLSDGEAEDLGPHAEPLARLSSAHGTYFVTGNHDYRHDADAWIETLAGFRVTTLRNTRTLIKHRGGAIDLAGVTDVEGEREHDGPDYHRALADRDRSRPVVLLAHQPVQVHQAARHGVDLQLSGHTHGGGFFPGNLLVPLSQPVTAGLATIDGTQLYVSRGAGASVPPIRVGAPPDITVVELHAL
ncbi:metallophosphoesterase [Streptomyces sp. NBC_00872]|uniref:metallophosphoesterase n=1 Tax=Streptomyces sp. NBC_00872 TaxID=2903686 RepID=UPI0038700FB8|nr:metallophosphoesterase [Streptomyces sp. NBC_00872]